MSGVFEVIGGIASIITTIEVIKKTYEAIQKLKDLPSAFEEVAARLPKVEDALEKVRRHAESHQGESATRSVQLAVQGCKPKVEKLKEIFHKIQQADEKTLGLGFRSFLVRFGKDSRVEDLMKGILRDTEAMASDRIFETATTQDIEELRKTIDVDAIRKAIEELSAVEPSVTDADFAGGSGNNQFGSHNTMRNYMNSGNGEQYNVETANSGASIGGRHTHNSSQINNGPLNHTLQVNIGQLNHTLQVNQIPEAKGGSRKEQLLSDLCCDDECPLIDASPDTCDWILNTNEFNRWASRGPRSSSNDPVILWIRGKRGSGKSTLVQFLFDRARRAKDSKRPGLFAPGIPEYFVAAFFFDAKRNTPQLYRSLIKQLIQPLPQDAFLFQDAAVLTKELADNDPRVLPKLKKLFRDTVNAYASNGHIFCFIDALDEATDSDIEEIIDFIQTIISDDFNRHVSFCISITPSPTIEPRLQTCLLDLSNHPDHQMSIKHYINARLKNFPSKKKTILLEEILKRAGGVFLWVALVVETLRAHKDETLKVLKGKLDKQPVSLDELYQAKLQRQGTENMSVTVICFQALLFGLWEQDGPTVHTLYHLLISVAREGNTSRREPEETFSEMKQYILRASQGLVEFRKIRSSRWWRIMSPPDRFAVQFIHGTVRSFLLGSQGLGHLDPSLRPNVHGLSHTRLRNLCIDYYLQTAVGDLPPPSGRQDESSRGRYTWLRYSIWQVLRHCEAAEECGQSQQDFFDSGRFNFQDWLSYVVPWMQRDRQRRLHSHFIRNHLQGKAMTQSIALHCFAMCNLPRLTLLHLKTHPESRACYVGDEQVVEDLDSPMMTSIVTSFVGDSSCPKDAQCCRFFDLCENDSRYHIDGVFIRDSTDTVAAIDYEFYKWPRDVWCSLIEDRFGKALLNKRVVQHEAQNSSLVRVFLSLGIGLLSQEARHMLVDPKSSHTSSTFNQSSTPADDMTMLHLAALWTENEEDFDLILDKYPKLINGQTRDMKTTLHFAVERGDRRMVKRLLMEEELDPNLQDNFRQAPLHMAVLGEETEVFELLLNDKRVDPNVRNADLETPLHRAASAGRKNRVKLLLKDRRVNPNVRNADLETPLHRAIRTRHAECVSLILDHPMVDREEQWKSGWLPYDLARASGNPDIIDLLARGPEEWSWRTKLLWDREYLNVDGGL